MSVAATLRLDADGRCADVRVALGGVAGVPVHARPVEDALRGEVLMTQRISDAAALVPDLVDPPDDARGSATYKRRMARVWTERALQQLARGKRMTATLDFPDPQLLFDEPEYRVEGPLKVTGAARYTADVQLPGMLWLAYTRSPRPHARILSVDALRRPGRCPGCTRCSPAPTSAHVGLGRRLLDWPALATDRVRMVGDRVAAVAAETKSCRRSRAGLVEVEYEDLPAGHPRQRPGRGRAVLHPDIDTYRYLGAKRPQTAHPTCTATR